MYTESVCCKHQEGVSLNELKGISTLGALSSEAISFLLDNGEVLLLSDGEYLFHTEDRSEGFYIILSGEVAFYKCSSGRRAFIRNYKVGEHIGVVGMITLQDRVGEAISVGESQVLFVSTNTFHDFYEESNQDFVLLLMNIVRDMARGLKEVDDMLVNRSE